MYMYPLLSQDINGTFLVLFMNGYKEVTSQYFSCLSALLNNVNASKMHLLVLMAKLFALILGHR
jgi:hypothetical protein